MGENLIEFYYWRISNLKLLTSFEYFPFFFIDIEPLPLKSFNMYHKFMLYHFAGYMFMSSTSFI